MGEDSQPSGINSLLQIKPPPVQKKRYHSQPHPADASLVSPPAPAQF